MKTIAILSSGSDNSGNNAVIRSVVRSAFTSGVNVFGVESGFYGLFENRLNSISSRDVSGKMGKAGCFLGTSNPNGILDKDPSLERCVQNLRAKNVDGVVVMGGRKSLLISKNFEKAGIATIGIPSTIQDDVAGTDICLGVDSAVNNIVKCVESIRACNSNERTFLIQVDGKRSGSLAMRAAVSSGAEMCLTPEKEHRDLSIVTKELQDMYMTGKTQCIALISTGWKPGIDKFAEYIESHEDESDLAVRKSVIGYIQRGGSPTAFDRLLGTNMGALAFQELIKGNSGKMIGYKDDEYTVVDYDNALKDYRYLDPMLRKLFLMTK